MIDLRINQTTIETRLLAAFARVSPHGIDPDSIEKYANDPPDLRCVSRSGTELYFEATTANSEDLEHLIGRKVAIRQNFDQLLASHPARHGILAHLQGRPVFADFNESISLAKAKAAVPGIVEFLRSVPKDDLLQELRIDHLVRMSSFRALKGTVLEITLGESTDGMPTLWPNFGMVEVNAPAQQILDRIGDKASKGWNAPEAGELIVYFSNRPTELSPDEVQELEVQIPQILRGTRFTRVWVFNWPDQEIVLSVPC